MRPLHADTFDHAPGGIERTRRKSEVKFGMALSPPLARVTRIHGGYTDLRPQRARLHWSALSEGKNGRGDRIRTCDPLLPKQMRYQAAPLPETACS